MDPLTILLFILIGLVVLLVLLLAVLGVFKKVQYSVKPTYERIEYLLSPAEHAFFTVLLQSVSEKEYVFAKVRVGDLVKVNGMVVESKDWWKYFSAIAQKHVNLWLPPAPLSGHSSRSSWMIATTSQQKLKPEIH
jgi:hypothetical protein